MTRKILVHFEQEALNTKQLTKYRGRVADT